MNGPSLLGLNPLIISWQASQVQHIPSQNQTNA